MDSITPILGGLAGLILAVAGLATALRRANREVQQENLAHRKRSALERMARDKASTVIYQLLGVVERSESYTPEIRRNLDSFEALSDRIDNGDTQETGVEA